MCEFLSIPTGTDRLTRLIGSFGLADRRRDPDSFLVAESWWHHQPNIWPHARYCGEKDIGFGGEDRDGGL